MKELLSDETGMLSSARVINLLISIALVLAFLAAVAAASWETVLKLADTLALYGAGGYGITKVPAMIGAAKGVAP